MLLACRALQVSGTGWHGWGVGGPEEAPDGAADVDVVREGGGLGRCSRVESDVDVVALTAVRVVHPHGDLASRRVVAVRQHLVVETEIGGFGGSHRHHAEGRWNAVVEVGRDL